MRCSVRLEAVDYSRRKESTRIMHNENVRYHKTEHCFVIEGNGGL